MQRIIGCIVPIVLGLSLAGCPYDLHGIFEHVAKKKARVHSGECVGHWCAVEGDDDAGPTPMVDDDAGTSVEPPVAEDPPMEEPPPVDAGPPDAGPPDAGDTFGPLGFSLDDGGTDAEVPELDADAGTPGETEPIYDEDGGVVNPWRHRHHHHHTRHRGHRHHRPSH